MHRTGIDEDDRINASVWAKEFHFDYCYWSCTDDGNYADQARVFNDLGQSILEAVWQGKNCSLFAYGQTGSGKSYSMMGTGGILDERLPPEEHGLVPRICSDLFDQINFRLAAQGEQEVIDNDDDAATVGESSLQCSVEVSYMEIYNESVYDLLSQNSLRSQYHHRQPLRVREHPRIGAYVDGLTTLSIDTYQEIEDLLEYGGGSRTVATTTMNTQSSRSHTIFTVNFRQSHVDTKKEVRKCC